MQPQAGEDANLQPPHQNFSSLVMGSSSFPKNSRDPGKGAFPKATAEQHDTAAAPQDLLLELGRCKGEL